MKIGSLGANLDRAIFWPLVAAVLLSPLPFASVRPWSWGLLGVVTGLALVAWALVTFARPSPPAASIGRIRVPVALFAVAALWVLFQVAAFTPTAWHHPIWQTATAALGSGVVGRIAVDPYDAGSSLARLLTYGGIFWLTLQYCRDRGTAKTVMSALAVAAVAYAAYGLAVEFSGLRMVAWEEKRHYLDSLTSTFVNRNSYATYAGLGLICVTALLTRRILRLLASGGSGRERLRMLINEIAGWNSLLIAAWFVIATSLLLTNSRAGVVSAAVGLAGFCVILALSPTVPRRIGLRIAGSALVAGLAFFVISGETVGKRLVETTIEGEPIRAELYRLTLDATLDTPILGMGYGSFGRIFRLYRDETWPSRRHAAKAHNTYLENAMELGVPAAMALLLSVVWLAGLCLKGVRHRYRDAVYPAAGIGATLLVGVHSLVDFSLQIPAVAATYSLLMGLACAQAWSSRRQDAD